MVRPSGSSGAPGRAGPGSWRPGIGGACALGMGPKRTHASVALEGFFPVKSDASGNVLITVDAVCRNGPDLTAFVNVMFF